MYRAYLLEMFYQSISREMRCTTTRVDKKYQINELINRVRGFSSVTLIQEDGRGDMNQDGRGEEKINELMMESYEQTNNR